MKLQYKQVFAGLNSCFLSHRYLEFSTENDLA